MFPATAMIVPPPQLNAVAMNAGSRNTQRPKDLSGKYIAHPLMPEHRPLEVYRND